ncbi:related to GTPase MTG2, mitochondrial [Saccharomycodes ludwigii]|uniref:Related to GTPase MTG2, mitochondrial n=1 Tax=Saccharomycodes ludwigii TaxID=36035 RepID=A0A376B4W7_9ASCO|nr:hypothetical protein SCDLUD_004764 [Saccharomycodes ludwigii]KAH3899325.1 hypothetical protein SCDLUD_004764 [Saccharomycodes ludwigii]SSD59662.1 related to GTPase MTG2, mitochondrial [Saccharomycodes ludwigii]
MFRYTKTVFSQVSRKGRNRLQNNVSHIPDNAPRLQENENWLQNLSSEKQLEPKISKALKLGNSVKKQIELVEDYPNGHIINENDKIDNHDSTKDYTIISTPPQTPFIHIKSPLINFTNIKYFNHSFNKQSNAFIDVRIVKCKSGDGGDGCVSFFRDANRAVGPPNGGDGGDGGSIYIQTDPAINSLAKLSHSYIATNGGNGAKDQLDGKRGKDILIKVPLGTLVKWSFDPKIIRAFINDKLENMTESNSNHNIRNLLKHQFVDLDCVGEFATDRDPQYIQLFRKSYEPGEGWVFKEKDHEYHIGKQWFRDLRHKIKKHDLVLDNDELLVDKFPLEGLDLDREMDHPVPLLIGGKGGMGNMHFLTNLIRNPRFAKVGRNGLEQYFMFELKILADLGLVGFPNAGKSTILNKISNAKPRIGHWEFTTLSPTIGTVSPSLSKPSFTVADIPGIIRGASKDKGMGLEFLRHIERSRGLVFVLGMDRPEPLEDLKVLIDELNSHGITKTHNALVICNKCDVNPEQTFAKFNSIQRFCNEMKWDICPISALNNENIDILISKMSDLVEHGKNSYKRAIKINLESL